jgi:hypothetical protein
MPVSCPEKPHSSSNWVHCSSHGLKQKRSKQCWKDQTNQNRNFKLGLMVLKYMIRLSIIKIFLCDARELNYFRSDSSSSVHAWRLETYRDLGFWARRRWRTWGRHGQRTWQQRRWH